MSNESLFAARPRPWQHPCGLDAVVEAWQSDAKVAHNMVLSHVEEPSAAAHAPLPTHLAPCLREALAKRGITQLYTHQARAFALADAGRDVVVATPTASGKSLCYNLPVLQRLVSEPEARALYLFPTKALSRDQEEALHALLREARMTRAAITYDGDTPADARRAAREQAGLLLTNPDMLHAGILPHHAAWARFFARLAYVVIDELHVYRGVFGSHVANVLRRVQRLARFHGSNPTFIMASATIGNARAHASRVVGRDVTLVEENGAPRGPRHVMVYNPPVVNHALGVRASYIKSTVRLALDLIRAEVPTLIFGHSRNNVEVMLKYLRDKVAASYIPAEAIQSYRGGYLPKTRRRIEAGLRAGEVRCVVATNALELGIDIGSLDAVICAGYPGSVAGMWQRFGRGGRRGGTSLAVLVTSSAPLDQYWAIAPHTLVGKAVEHARIDPDNVEVLVQHLKCAAFELPFDADDDFGDLPADAIADALDYLTQHRVLHPVQNGPRTTFHWSAESYPANNVSLRQVGWDNFVIIDRERDINFAEMDWRSAHTMLHEQAIYQHAGEQYQVEKLDYDNRKAFVRKVAPDYYTDAMTHTKITVMEAESETPLEGQAVPQAKGFVGQGDVSVVDKVVGFKKIKFHTHENVGFGEVNLPEMQMHTTAFWLRVPGAALAEMDYLRPELVDGLRGVAHAMHTIAAVGLMIDPRDLGRAVEDGHDDGQPDTHPAGFDPTLFLYDSVPGGTGLAARLFEDREALLRRTRDVLAGCPCDAGCPGCVGPVIEATAGGDGDASNMETTLTTGRKRVAQYLLARMGVPAMH